MTTSELHRYDLPVLQNNVENLERNVIMPILNIN